MRRHECTDPDFLDRIGFLDELADDFDDEQAPAFLDGYGDSHPESLPQQKLTDPAFFDRIGCPQELAKLLQEGLADPRLKRIILGAFTSSLDDTPARAPMHKELTRQFLTRLAGTTFARTFVASHALDVWGWQALLSTLVGGLVSDICWTGGLFTWSPWTGLAPPILPQIIQRQ